MFEQNYENLLKQITIQSIARMIGGNDDISNLLFALIGATASRRIVDCVQFEEDWQGKIDKTDTWYVMIDLKVAPSLCEIAYRNGGALNEASWEFVIPNVTTLEVSAIPANAIDYLAMGKVMVDMTDDEGYSYTCLKNVLESIGR